jgi:hypothetical protein
MKKILLIAVLTLVVAMFALSAFGMSVPRDEFQTIKKAVKENPEAVSGREAKWFKILVTDTKTGKETVKVTLPISVFDIISDCVDLKNVKVDDWNCKVDLRALFKELKAAGPMMFIEVQEKDEIVKIWLE